ncbi:DUF488 domain-containing protein [Prevotella sp. KH2C16]|uniref:DUF488 domain-containing protein n=1 Tax=Prevotella sp. KH2C16 TaxID=1855325 RepID=UPI0008DF4ADE|nr:DUF488 domain-containing protein [Prevotella sp. KH2C16]SFF84531.1 Uncharacterized conserved protein YeaO, DUF488 family [Prevotella sp. KH2C16]
MNQLQVKRVYLPADEADGHRILIDRLWPRGLKKEAAALDEWCREIAPTPDLRKWFGHKEENFGDFSARYRAELERNPAALPFARHIRELLKEGNVTLLFGAKSPTCNHAVVLKNWILTKDLGSV